MEVGGILPISSETYLNLNLDLNLLLGLKPLASNLEPHSSGLLPQTSRRLVTACWV